MILRTVAAASFSPKPPYPCLAINNRSCSYIFMVFAQKGMMLGLSRGRSFYCRFGRPHYSFAYLFRGAIDEMVEEFTTLDKLHDQIDCRVGVKSVDEAHDVWMVQFGHDSNFLLKLR